MINADAFDPAKSLYDLMDGIEAVLRADPWFQPVGDRPGIDVFTEKKGDLDSLIDIAIGNIGLAVTIFTPSASMPEADRIPVLAFNPAFVDVQVTEFPIGNRDVTGTGKTALSTVLRIMQLLHGSRHGGGPGKGVLGELQLLPDPFRLVETSPYLVYLVRFQAQVEILTPRIPVSVILGEGGEPILGEGGEFILSES